MTRLLPLLAAAALLAWLWRRRDDVEDRAAARAALRKHANEDWSQYRLLEDEDGVQPADPVTVRGYFPYQWMNIPDPTGWKCSYGHNHRPGDVCVMNNTFVHDPTYDEAVKVAIRRGGQSSERTTGGM